MPYKILSLDGGGSWAIIQLLTLKYKYGNVNGHEILRDFDMIIANSGGSIALAALAENWTIDKAITLFDKKEIREQVFHKNGFKDRFFPIDYIRLFKGFGPKYSSPKKGKAFKNLFPELDKRQMNELPKFIGKESLKLIICTYDALNNRAKFFKSYGNGVSYDSIKLTQAIHGSSNAPIQYFDFPARFKAKNSEIFYELWDGALGGFNNPVTAGVIEAMKEGVELDKIKVISIGTGNKLMSNDDKKRFFQVKQITQKERRKKLRFWRLKYQIEYFTKTILNQATTILYEPPDWANYVAYMFLLKNGEKDIEQRLIRMSPMIHTSRESSTEIKILIEKLYQLDMDLTEDKDIELLKECFQKWSTDEIFNQPIDFRVERNNDLTYLIGDKNFSNAIKKW
ncbi:patatin-like phospholipase family protein [uncultured Tenacibaculum sp.]|uniref:patatin-like phospholipase family protein n=1 Tax=uncultured Tenacibaculum sp. TaxID=174713 RepID=UPI00262A9D1B|nr:patatin-like phospholipase family protein [uncultured Tenacibaculum sp.]